MEKPKKHTKEFYDWNEAVKYIESKYNISIHNYTDEDNEEDEDEYRDFWHSICDGLHNGSDLNIESDWGTEDYFEEEWERKIAQLFVNEFVDESGSATFYVWW